MTSPTPTRIKVPQAVHDACSEAAQRSDVTLTAWALAALDCAAGLTGSPPGHRMAKPPAEADPGREGTINLRIPPDRLEAYQAAARAALLPLGSWAGLVLAAACGASGLPGQLSRVARKGRAA